MTYGMLMRARNRIGPPKNSNISGILKLRGFFFYNVFGFLCLLILKQFCLSYIIKMRKIESEYSSPSEGDNFEMENLVKTSPNKKVDIFKLNKLKVWVYSKNNRFSDSRRNRKNEERNQRAITDSMPDSNSHLQFYRHHVNQNRPWPLKLSQTITSWVFDSIKIIYFIF